VHNIRSTTHTIDVEKRGNTVRIFLKDGSRGGDRDFIMNYELRGKALSTGLMLYEGNNENFFMMMMQPPKRVATDDMPAREYVFIVDVSGSMHGFPLNTAKEVLEGLMGGMRSEDRFNVLMFSGGSRVLSPRSLPATAGNIANALQVIDGIQGGGGTRLLPALQRALKMKTARNSSRIFVVITDGYVTVESEAYQLIRNNLGKANLFAFGIGSSVNRHLVESVARAGLGEAFIVTGPQDVHKKVAKFHRYIAAPALTNIEIKFDGFKVHDVEPKNIPDVFAERPIVVYGKYTGKAGGRIHVKGATGSRSFSKTLHVEASPPQTSNQAIRFLWARNRIAQWSDMMSLSHDTKFKKAITQLGLSYNLLTQYTSFVAVDERIRNTSGKSQKVIQAVPLPHGVENSAMGNASGSPTITAPSIQAQGFAGQGIVMHGSGSGGGGSGAVGRAYGRGMAVMTGSKSAVRRKRGKQHKKALYHRLLAPATAKAGEDVDEEEKAEDKTKKSRFKLVSVSGTLHAGDIQAVLKRWLARLLGCRSSGSSLIKIVVDKSGRVTQLLVMSSGKGAARAQSCIRTLKPKLLFPKSKGESTLRILLYH
jgi:Ca-activated chloride channel family protein